MSSKGAIIFQLILVTLALKYSDAEGSCLERKPVFCYWASWAVYRPGLGAHKIENINPEYCTHLIYTFSGINLSGDIDSLDNHNDIVNGGYKNFVALKQKNPCLKTLLAIGGWNEGSEKYSLVAETEESRTKFAEKVIRFLINYGFDGFDVDWEYPTQRGGLTADRVNFVALLKALRDRLAPRNRLLTIAVTSSVSVSKLAYDIKNMCRVIDFVSIMGYDMQKRNETSIHSPLKAERNEPYDRETLDKIIQHYKSQGCPLNKIILGVPAYGRTFTLENAEKTSIGASVSGPGREGTFTREAGFIGFNEICELQKIRGDWKKVYLEKNAAVYGWTNKLWISYDDPKTIAQKAKYVLHERLGGMMVWSIDTDDFNGKCSGEVYPLLRAINRGLGNPLSDDFNMNEF